MNDVLAAIDIVDIVGASVELKSSGGGRFVGLCPFHAEKTPSFSVNRDRQMYYCFGCQKSGDVLTFLREHEGLSFIEGLQRLAERAGVQLPALSERDNKEDFQRAQLGEMVKFAARFFAETLDNPLKGGRGRQYLKGRELGAQTAKRFGLGYAPEGWSNLVDAARGAGFKDAVIESSGLAKRGDKGGLYDFFRNRLMFPIRNVAGNAVAFGGRDLGDGPAKYINSPESPVYKKGRILYGLYEARDALRREKRAILVEGYFDLLRCFDAGIENVVATCGTALTADQAALIRRYVPEVVVVYDGDAAGVTAAMRGIGILSGAGLSVRALILPDGQDPDDFIKASGGEAFRSLVSDAQDFVGFYVRANATRLGSIEGRTDVARALFGVLADVTDGLRRDEYLRRTAQELHLDEWRCAEEFRKFVRDQGGGAGAREAKVSAAPEQPITPQERDLIVLLLHNGALLAQAKEALAGVNLEPGPLGEVLSVLFAEEGPGMARRLQSEQAGRLYASASNVPPEQVGENPEVLLRDTIASLKCRALRVEAAHVLEEMREADPQQDGERLKLLLSRKAELERKIEAVASA